MCVTDSDNISDEEFTRYLYIDILILMGYCNRSDGTEAIEDHTAFTDCDVMVTQEEREEHYTAVEECPVELGIDIKICVLLLYYSIM